MPTYPPSLPHLARLSHLEETLGADTIRTKMSIGPDKVRRRSSVSPDSLSLGCNSLTATQKSTLTTFFKVTLGGGALSFDMADPDGGSSSFRFLSPPKYKPVGNSKYSVSAELERLP
jgi:hypothetical protein